MMRVLRWLFPHPFLTVLLTVVWIMLQNNVTAGMAGEVYGAEGDGSGVYENRVEVAVSEPQLTPRAAPLRDFPGEKVIEVTDFGAVPDDEPSESGRFRGLSHGRFSARVAYCSVA